MTKKGKKNGIPSSFEASDSKKARFWAWLSGKYPVSSEDNRIDLVSEEELRDLIKQAMSENRPNRARELLDIISTEEVKSHEIVRRSLRVGTGEYFKLYETRSQKNTSMGEAVERILAIGLKEHLDSINKQLKPKPSSTEADKLEHLYDLIESWQGSRPSSRTVASMLQIPTPESIEPYSHYDKDIVEKFKALVWADICEFFGAKEVAKHFKKDWDDMIENYFWDCLRITATVDNKVKDRFLFKLSFRVGITFDDDDEKILFETYGEDNVMQYVNHFDVAEGHNSRGGYSGLRGASQFLGFVAIELQIDFEPGYVGEITGPKDFEVMIAVSKESGSDASIPHMDDIQDMVDAAKERVDFEEVEYQYARVQKARLMSELRHWGRGLIENSITKASVASFYINPDLWRVVPLILENTNWLELVDKYLDESSKEGKEDESG